MWYYFIIGSDNMTSRMDRYYDEEVKNVETRSSRNSELYKKISDSEINDFDRNSNATVLTEVKNEIDIEKIKKILDNKYNVAPKRKSIRIDVEDDDESVSLDATREYDINAILQKAKVNKDEEDYEIDRLKKLRDTQFNILSNLNLSKNEEEVESEEEKTLINLINTITEREMLNREKDLDPLDILSDLKDDDSDIVLDDDKTLPSSELGEDADTDEYEEDKTIDTSFYTESNKFTDSDFDDFNDLKAEVSSHKILLKVVIAFLFICIIVGVLIILNFINAWGLF